MSRRKTGKVIVRAVEALRRSRNEPHIQHRLNASGTGAHRNRKRYCRKAKHPVDHRSEA
jgi:hypothetical protein